MRRKKVAFIMMTVLSVSLMASCKQQPADTIPPESSKEASVLIQSDVISSVGAVSEPEEPSYGTSRDESGNVYITTTPTSDFQYLIVGEKARLIKYLGASGSEVIVPETIRDNGKEYPVEVGAGCFAGTGIVSLTLPDGITVIPDNMCEKCKNLHTVRFKNITSIGRRAFYGCEELTISQNSLNDGNYSIITDIKE